MTTAYRSLRSISRDSSAPADLCVLAEYLLWEFKGSRRSGDSSYVKDWRGDADKLHSRSRLSDLLAIRADAYCRDAGQERRRGDLLESAERLSRKAWPFGYHMSEDSLWAKQRPSAFSSWNSAARYISEATLSEGRARWIVRDVYLEPLVTILLCSFAVTPRSAVPEITDWISDIRHSADHYLRYLEDTILHGRRPVCDNNWCTCRCEDHRAARVLALPSGPEDPAPARQERQDTRRTSGGRTIPAYPRLSTPKTAGNTGGPSSHLEEAAYHHMKIAGEGSEVLESARRDLARRSHRGVFSGPSMTGRIAASSLSGGSWVVVNENDDSCDELPGSLFAGNAVAGVIGSLHGTSYDGLGAWSRPKPFGLGPDDGTSWTIRALEDGQVADWQVGRAMDNLRRTRTVATRALTGASRGRD